MKAFTIFTVKTFSPAPDFNELKSVTYEVPGTGQEVVKNFRDSLPKGSVSLLRGFFLGEDRKFIPVNLNSI
jgi:hypothetical protein